MRLLVGHRAVEVDRFGGLVTLIPRENLPLGASPSCQNVEFDPTVVKSRWGTSAVVTIPAPSLGIVGIDSADLVAGLRHVFADQFGILYERIPPSSTPSVIANRVFAVDTQTRMDSAVLYGRTHFCLSTNGGLGAVEPSTWDGTNRDRFTYGAPGKAPTFGDSGNPGNVGVGDRIGAVCYVMRSGYITPPCWSLVFVTNGGQSLSATDIPIGPPACVKRMLFVASPLIGTQYAATDLYHIPSRMLINNNTTTSLEIDFTDNELLSGEQLSNFIGYDAVSDLLQVVQYNQRAMAIGEVPVIRSRDNASYYTLAVAPQAPTALNLRFDGGPDTGGTPYGWAVQGGSTGGTFEAVVGAVDPCWVITSDGATADQGWIRNGISVGFSQLEAALALGQEIGVRIRMQRLVNPSDNGVIRVALRDSNAAPTFNLTADFPVADMSGKFGWTTFSATLGTLTTYGTDLAVDILMTTPADFGTAVAIQGIEFYRTSELSDSTPGNSVVRGSFPFDSESFDVTTGFVGVGVGDGQTVRAGFVIGGSLYLVKERSLWVTVDDNVNEPAAWVVRKLSDTVGCFTPRAVGLADGWVAIIARDGLYRFDGGVPQKLSQEIQPTWDSIRWDFAHLFWCVVDEKLRRIYCGVMISDSGSLDLNTVLVLDYQQGMGETQRRWTPWDGTPAGLSAQLVTEPDLTRSLYFGPPSPEPGEPTAIYKYDQTAHNDGDDELAIEAFYETASISADFDVELTSAIRIYASGEGIPNISVLLANGTEALTWQPTLNATTKGTQERFMRYGSERLGVKLWSDAVGTWWKLFGAEVWMKPQAFWKWRGRTT